MNLKNVPTGNADIPTVIYASASPVKKTNIVSKSVRTREPVSLARKCAKENAFQHLAAGLFVNVPKEAFPLCVMHLILVPAYFAAMPNAVLSTTGRSAFVTTPSSRRQTVTDSVRRSAEWMNFVSSTPVYANMAATREDATENPAPLNHVQNFLSVSK